MTDDRVVVATTEGALRIFEPVGGAKPSPQISQLPNANISISSRGARRGVGVDSSQLMEDSKMALPVAQSYAEIMTKPSLGKSVDQLLIIEASKLMIAVVDASVRVYDLPSFNLRSKLDGTKAAYLISCNKHHVNPADLVSMSSSLLLCVAVKRRLLIYRLDNANFKLTNDIPVSSSVRCMEWVGASVCVGSLTEYNLVHASGAVTDLFPVGKKGKPLCCLLPDQEILLVKENEGICVSWDGKATREEPVRWSEVPQFVAYVHPYVIVGLTTGVEVRNMVSLAVTQLIDMRGVKCIGTKSVQHLFLASPSALSRLELVPFALQVEELVNHHLFKEALDLVSLNDDQDMDWELSREQRLNDIHIRYAYFLFNKGEYEDAMRYFQQTNIQPQQILALFPEVLPHGQCRNVKHPVKINKIIGENNFQRVPLIYLVVSFFPCGVLVSNCRGVGHLGSVWCPFMSGRR